MVLAAVFFSAVFFFNFLNTNCTEIYVDPEAGNIPELGTARNPFQTFAKAADSAAMTESISFFFRSGTITKLDRSLLIANQNISVSFESLGLSGPAGLEITEAFSLTASSLSGISFRGIKLTNGDYQGGSILSIFSFKSTAVNIKDSEFALSFSKGTVATTLMELTRSELSMQACKITSTLSVLALFRFSNGCRGSVQKLTVENSVLYQGALFLGGAGNNFTLTDCIFQNNTLSASSVIIADFDVALLEAVQFRKNLLNSSQARLLAFRESAREIRVADSYFSQNSKREPGSSFIFLDGKGASGLLMIGASLFQANYAPFATLVEVRNLANVSIARTSAENNGFFEFFLAEKALVLDIRDSACKDNNQDFSGQEELQAAKGGCFHFVNILEKTLSKVIISNNAALDRTAGIAIEDSDNSLGFSSKRIEINESLFKMNVVQFKASSNFGAALFVDSSSDVLLRNCVFESNKILPGDSALPLIKPGGPCINSRSFLNDLIMIGSEFKENYSRHLCACIMFNGVNLNVLNSSFEGNQPIVTARDYEEHKKVAGIFPSVYDTLLSSFGGAINTLADNININSSAFVGNKAFRGAVLYVNGKDSLSSINIVFQNSLMLRCGGSKGMALYYSNRFNYLFYEIRDSIVMRNEATESALFFGDMSASGVKLLHAHHSYFYRNFAEFNIFSQFMHSYVEFSDCIIAYNAAFSSRPGYPSSVIVGFSCPEISDHLFSGNTYYGNYVTAKCGVISIGYCKFKINGDKFIDNYANNDAGALFIFDSTEIEIANTSFIQNYVALGGACIFSSDPVILKISRSVFRNSSAGIKGAALSIRENKLTLIEDSVFEENQAYTGSVLAGLDIVSLIFRRCVIIGNRADIEIFELKNTRLSITGCWIRNTKTNIFNLENVVGEVALTRIENAFCRSLYQGCVMSISESSNITIRTSVFEVASASVMGGALYISNSNLTLVDVQMSNASSSVDASCVFAVERSFIFINKSNFSDYSKYCLYGQEASIVVLHSAFKNGNRASNKYAEAGEYHGALYCFSCLLLEVEFTSFEDGLAANGAGFQVLNTKLGVSLFSCSFKNNRAGSNGGAIYLINTNVTMDSVTFAENTAGVAGGAIYFSSDQRVSLAFVVNNSKFESNRAGLEGGGIKWLETMPTLNNCSFISNSALYGADLAAFPIRLNLKVFSNAQDIETDAPLFNLFESQGEADYNKYLRQKIAPGQKFPIKLKLEAIDIYGQVVKSLNDQVVEIKVVPLNKESTNKPYLLGTASLSTVNGGFSLENVQIFSQESQDIELHLGLPSITKFYKELLSSSSSRPLTNMDRNINGGYKFVLYAGTSTCPNGTIFNPDINSCLKCPFNFISLSPELQSSCTRCAAGAICPGGAEITSRSGFWLSSNLSIKPVECPEKELCLEGPPRTCKHGHQGPICMGCIVNYDRNPFGICVVCNENAATLYLQIVGYFCLLVLVSTFMIRASFRNVKKVKARTSSSMTIVRRRTVDNTGRVSINKVRELKMEELNSLVEDQTIYYKILLNYLQLLGIVRSLPMKWPDYFKGYFNSFRFFNIFSVQFFSLECIIKYTGVELKEAGEGERIAMVFVEGIFLNLVVVSYFFLLCLLFYIYSKINHKQKIKKNILISFLILYDMIQPTLVQENANMFLCLEVEGKYYLQKDANISCDTELYKYLTNFFFLFFLLVWTLIIPGSIFTYLWRNKTRLNEFKVFSILGSYYVGYQQKYYFWDFIIMFRENVVIFVNMLRISDELKIHFVLILVSISFFLQLSYKPLLEVRFNLIEQLAISVTLVTVFSGLLYLSGSSEELTLVAVIFTILLNVLFICVWARGFLGVVLIKIVIPTLIRTLKNEKVKRALSRYLKPLNTQKTLEDSATLNSNKNLPLSQQASKKHSNPGSLEA